MSQPHVVLTGAQLRAARALLGWSAARLADESGVSRTTIVRAERQGDAPISTMPANIVALVRAIEAGGVVLIGRDASGGAGVRLRS